MGNTCQQQQEVSTIFKSSFGQFSSLNPKRSMNQSQADISQPKEEQSVESDAGQLLPKQQKILPIQEQSKEEKKFNTNIHQDIPGNPTGPPQQKHQQEHPQTEILTPPQQDKNYQCTSLQNSTQDMEIKQPLAESSTFCENNYTEDQRQEKLKKQKLIDKISSSQLSVNSFVIEKTLGQGAFGQVSLVRKVDVNPTQGSPGQRSSYQQLYAMKCISKKDMLNLNLVEATLLERNILKKNNKKKHPFIVELKYSFQTQSKIYFIMEHVPCGDLYKLLQRVRNFNEEQARFIMAETVCAIEYLHTQMKIIYRDLKPENVLITADGHIKLSDFGLSKQFKDSSEISYTFAGTPEYLAPEIIQQTGHNKNVDLWGLGVFLYELLKGKPPFVDQRRNFNQIQRLIIQNQPRFPFSFSQTAIDLISKLLVTEQEKRLGANDIDALKQHQFFNGIDWDQLIQLKVQSPLKQFFQGKDQQNLFAHMKPRSIYETPDQYYPNIQGISYNPDIQNDSVLTSTISE